MRVVAFLGAFSEGMSGGDACFIEIAKRQANWDLLVVTSALGRSACTERGLRARFLIVSNERRFHRPVPTYTRRTLVGLARLRTEAAADVYYATSDFLPDTVLAGNLRRQNPHSVWVQKVFHLIPRERTISHYAQLASLRLIRTAADRVIVDNHLLKDALVRRGHDPRRIGINYPGIDVQYFRRLPSVTPLRYDAAFLARLVPSKGALDIVPIWKRVVGRRPGARLAVIGRGSPSMMEELNSQIRRNGLEENVDLLGYLANDEAFAILKASRVFLCPSHEEGFGIAVLEAIALGLPVVAYDLPAFSEVFPSGMLRLPIGDTAQFADATFRLLEDEGLIKRVVTASAEVPDLYDWDQAAAREAEEIARARANG